MFLNVPSEQPNGQLQKQTNKQIIIIIIIIKLRKFYHIKTYNGNLAHLEYKSKVDFGNKRGNWNHLKIIRKIPEQLTRKARNQELQKTALLYTAHVLRGVLM